MNCTESPVFPFDNWVLGNSWKISIYTYYIYICCCMYIIVVMKRRIRETQSENKCLEWICMRVYTHQRVEGTEQSGELWDGLLEQQIKQLGYFCELTLFISRKCSFNGWEERVFREIEQNWEYLRALRGLMKPCLSCLNVSVQHSLHTASSKPPFCKL